MHEHAEPAPESSSRTPISPLLHSGLLARPCFSVAAVGPATDRLCLRTRTECLAPGLRGTSRTSACTAFCPASTRFLFGVLSPSVLQVGEEAALAAGLTSAAAASRWHGVVAACPGVLAHAKRDPLAVLSPSCLLCAGGGALSRAAHMATRTRHPNRTARQGRNPRALHAPPDPRKHARGVARDPHSCICLPPHTALLP